MKKTILIIVIANIFLFSVSVMSGFEGLLFKPPVANSLEPRVGALYQFSAKKLRLDIGTSVDLFQAYSNATDTLNLGTDFFTLTRLRSVGNFKFPVETSDYFFGINSSFKGKISSLTYSTRFRLAHISSHLVDGLAKDSLFTRNPFVYSREFAEVIAALHLNYIRPYAGLTYVFSRKPNDAEPVIPQLGFDINYSLNKWISFVAGYDFKLIGINSVYTGTNSAQAGILFKTWNDYGILISGYGFDGRSIHGMFYKERDSYFGLGFQVFFY